MLIELNKTRLLKFIIYSLLLSVVFISACDAANDELPQREHKVLMEDLSTDEEGLYNLYFFGNNTSESKSIKSEFNENWRAEDYLNVYNTRSYNIANPEYTPSQDIIDSLELNEDNTPIFFLFDNEGITLKTDQFNEVLSYLDKRK